MQKATRGSRSMFLCFREPRSVSTRKAPSSNRYQTGAICGVPSRFVVPRRPMRGPATNFSWRSVKRSRLTIPPYGP
jgi:hypothetical protein